MEHASAGMEAFAALVDLLGGDLEMAATRLRRGFDSLRHIGDRWYSGALAVMLAEVLHDKGEVESVRDLLKYFHTVGSHERTVEVRALGTEAKILSRAGQHADAEKFAQRGVALSQQTDHLNDQADAYMRLSFVLRMNEQLQEAAAAAEDAQARYMKKGNTIDAEKAAIASNVKTVRRQ
jgi:hypothetical protein